MATGARNRRAYIESAARAAVLALLEYDYARGAAEALAMLGEALGAEGLAVYAVDFGGAGYVRELAWPDAASADLADAADAAEIESQLSGRAVAEFAVRGAAGARGLALSLRSGQAGAPAGRAGFLAARFPGRPHPASIDALTAFALSLSAARARDQADREALRASEAAERSRKAGALLLARAGHELKTPLVALDGIAALLEERGESMDPARRREALRLVREGGGRLLRLVEEVLDLARMDAGLRAAKIEAVDFGAIASQAEALMAGLLRGKRAGFAARPAPNLPRSFMADADALRRILENLLGNAAKYSPEGLIELVVEPAGPGVLGAGAVRFEVRDAGPGIDPEIVRRIAEPFHPSTAGSAGERGSGLGLTIVWQLAQGMGAAFSLDALPGGGTAARLIVPPAISRPAQETR